MLELYFHRPTRSLISLLGDVCRVHIFGKSLIFLSSPEAVFDLLEKRGSIYSDKLHLVMTSDLCVHILQRACKFSEFIMATQRWCWPNGRDPFFLSSVHGDNVRCQVVFTGYGETLKRQRRLMHHALGPSSVRSYDPRVESETKAFLHRLLVDPEDYLASLRR
jgi:cytochrome P450